MQVSRQPAVRRRGVFSKRFGACDGTRQGSIYHYNRRFRSEPVSRDDRTRGEGAPAAEAADAEAKAAQAAAQANAEAAQAPTRSTQFPPLQPPPVADTTAFQRLLPGGARIIEAVDLTAIAGKARVMMLWMLSPNSWCASWPWADVLIDLR